MQKPSEVLRCLELFFAAGVEEALKDALPYCDAFDVTPEWVERGLRELALKYLNGHTRAKKLGHEKGKKLKTLEDEFVRWLAVMRCHEAGMKHEDAYEWLAEHFSSSDVHAISASSFKKSHEIVRSALKTEQGAAQYYLVGKKRKFDIGEISLLNPSPQK